MSKNQGQKTVVENRKARHEYHIREVYEAGLVLVGTEVKALRQGKGNLTDAYAQVKQGEVWLLHFHISPYEPGNRFNHDPLRPRKLLLHRREIAKLTGIQKTTGFTLIPLRVFLTRGLVKLDLAVAVGKKLHDKREDMAEKDAKRYLERVSKAYAHSR
jgi:SsrA-binding protein